MNIPVIINSNKLFLFNQFKGYYLEPKLVTEVILEFFKLELSDQLKENGLIVLPSFSVIRKLTLTQKERKLFYKLVRRHELMHWLRWKKGKKKLVLNLLIKKIYSIFEEIIICHRCLKPNKMPVPLYFKLIWRELKK